MKPFVTVERDIDYLLLTSISIWLTKDHLAGFFLELIDGLDLWVLNEQAAKEANERLG